MLQQSTDPWRELPHVTEYTVKCGDCRAKLREVKPNSIHLVVTDPPYFLDGLDSEWRKGGHQDRGKKQVVGRLPVGMKFDPRQGRALQKFIGETAEALLPCMVPGAFALVFSQPRLVHRMAVGMEDAGFEIRDMYAWHFTAKAQAKAFGMEHFIDRMSIPARDKKKMKKDFNGYKTAQLRPQFESILLAQKPKKGTHISNWREFGTGLFHSSERLDDCAPSTVMRVEKPHRQTYNGHLTVKPVRLVEYLIRLFSKEGQYVLDPFLGSGTTAVAAKRTRRSCIGIEVNRKYIDIALKRIDEALHGDGE